MTNIDSEHSYQMDSLLSDLVTIRATKRHEHGAVCGGMRMS